MYIDVYSHFNDSWNHKRILPKESLLSYKIYLSCYNKSDQRLVLNSYSPIACFDCCLQCYTCIEFINVRNNDSSMNQMQDNSLKQI